MGDSLTLRFLTDEDVPRSTARALRDAGFDALDVRDVGLRGHGDADVYAYAQKDDRILATCDMGFSNILNFPPSKSRGLVVVRIPDSEPIHIFNREVVKTAQDVGERLLHHLAIVEVGRVRLRK
jgi:predicted nuclease of predicted toxin-antitoxin system